MNIHIMLITFIWLIAVITCELELFLNYFSLCRRQSEIILPEIVLKYIISEAYCSSRLFSNMFNVTEITLKRFQCFISHVTTP